MKLNKYLKGEYTKDEYDSIEELCLSGYDDITDFKGLEKLKNLKKLHLDNNEIRNLKGIGKLKKINLFRFIIQ